MRWRCPDTNLKSRMEQSMRRTLLWSVVSMLSLMVAVQAQDKMGGGTEKAVAALEQQWLESQKTNNPDLVAPLLAEKFVNTGSDGKVTSKAESLATAKATNYDSAEYEDIKVTAFGNTAIATGGFA